MHSALKTVAMSINFAYEKTAHDTRAHDAINDLRQDMANRLAAAGYCTYDEFSDLARIKR